MPKQGYQRIPEGIYRYRIVSVTVDRGYSPTYGNTTAYTIVFEVAVHNRTEYVTAKLYESRNENSFYQRFGNQVLENCKIDEFEFEDLLYAQGTVQLVHNQVGNKIYVGIGEIKTMRLAE